MVSQNAPLVPQNAAAAAEFTGAILLRYAAEFVVPAVVTVLWCDKALSNINPWLAGGCVGAGNTIAYAVIEAIARQVSPSSETSWGGWLIRKVVQLVLAAAVATGLHVGVTAAMGVAAYPVMVAVVAAVSSLTGSLITLMGERVLTQKA